MRLLPEIMGLFSGTPRRISRRMSSEDEGEEVENNNSANNDSKIESIVLPEDASNSTGTTTKRKRSGLNIPITNTANLPTWVAGKSLR